MDKKVFGILLTVLTDIDLNIWFTELAPGNYTLGEYDIFGRQYWYEGAITDRYTDPATGITTEKGAMFAGIPMPESPKDLDVDSFRLSDEADGGAMLKGKAVSFRLALPNGVVRKVPGGGDVGAWQGEALYELPFDLSGAEPGRESAVG